jgi:ketosteroid isomerase-like protein
MSSNVDLVRSLYTAWERGDWDSTDWADEEIEYVWADGPHPGRWTGRAGMAKGFRDFLSAWDVWRARAVEYRELDDERVLALTQWSGRGKSSGMDIGQMHSKGAALFHVRDEKVTKLVAYLDRDRAFADLGLAPQESP